MLHQQIELHNIKEITPLEGQKGFLLHRLPNELRVQLHEFALNSGLCASGVEIRFHMKAEAVKLRLLVMNHEALKSNRHSIVQVYHGNFQEPWPRIIGAHEMEIEIKPPEEIEHLKELARKQRHAFSPDLVRVILPHECQIALVDVEGETEPPRPGSTPALHLLAYGSSITHGASSIRPTGAYIMRTAERLGMDLYNQGLAGGAMLDVPMAKYIAGRSDWDLAVLELGINMIWDVPNERPGDPDEFRTRVDHFISIIAEAHPDKWIFCTDLFTFKGDTNADPLAKQFRSIVSEKIESLNMPKLVYIPGTELLTGTEHLSSDLIHPAEEGHLEISQKLAEKICKIYYT